MNNEEWNFLTDHDGNWYWNPACHETPSGLDTVDGAQLVSLTRRRSIDYPIIFIYIRKAIGERDYGRFIERHGIPHAVRRAPGQVHGAPRDRCDADHSRAGRHRLARGRRAHGGLARDRGA